MPRRPLTKEIEGLGDTRVRILLALEAGGDRGEEGLENKLSNEGQR